MSIKNRYTQDNLSPEELEQLTAELLEAKFDRENENRFRAALAEKHEIHRPTQARPKIRRMVLTLLSTAAAIALLIFAATSWLEPVLNYQELTSELLAVPYANQELRKGGSDADKLRSQAIAAYQDGDFRAAVTYRQALVEQSTPTEEDLFFLGLSYLYQKPVAADQAIQQFQGILRAAAPKRQEEARWYLALAYLTKEQLEQAYPLLRDIVAKQEWKYQEAQQLLEVLPTQ